jgi:glycosyltransferase involved in cell wall biosynthesis
MDTIFCLNPTSNAKRILLITYEYGKKISGGVGRVVNAITEKLRKHIPVDVFCLKTPIPILGMIAVEFYQLDSAQTLVRTFAGRLDDLLGKLLRNNPYQAVHVTHNGISSAKCIRFIKKNFPGLKIIFSCHSIAKYENGIRKPRKYHLKCEEYILSNIDHIHLLNKTSLTFLKESYTARKFASQISIIPNGIEENGFQEMDHRWKAKIKQQIDPENNITVLCMSRWCQGKGLEYFLEAAYLVSQKMKNIRFIIAGRKLISWEKSGLSYMLDINQRISKLKGFVISLGWLNDIQRNTIFSLADIWIMPSLLEYFPYSILEPMINHIPIISSRIDPVAELLEEDKECLFYDPQNSGELARKMIFMAKNREVRQFLAQNAYRKAKEELVWERIAQMYLAMYHHEPLVTGEEYQNNEIQAANPFGRTRS